MKFINSRFKARINSNLRKMLIQESMDQENICAQDVLHYYNAKGEIDALHKRVAGKVVIIVMTTYWRDDGSIDVEFFEEIDNNSPLTQDMFEVVTDDIPCADEMETAIDTYRKLRHKVETALCKKNNNLEFCEEKSIEDISFHKNGSIEVLYSHVDSEGYYVTDADYIRVDDLK